MDSTGFLDRLTTDGALLARAARTADLAAPVPGLEWTVRDVVAHAGAVHRWCADLVARRLVGDETGGSAHFRTDRPDAALVDWFAEGLTALTTTLAATPEDAVVWGFGRSVPARAFWSRRQAHETAVHRADVEGGAGREVTPVGADFAQDGLDELTGFARGFRSAPGAPCHLALLASDGDDRLITFDGGRITAAQGADTAPAQATVAGTSSDLYLWAWNRPSAAVEDGDAAVIARWREVCIS